MKKTTLTTLGKVKINNFTHKITCTRHGIKRMTERGINLTIATNNIKALGEKRLAELKTKNAEIMIIDKDNDISIVAAFLKTSIRIITVIDKSQVYVKEGTLIVNL